jgi:hypothetical protein
VVAHPAQDGSHAAGTATSRCGLLPCPQRSRQPRALSTPAGPAWSVSGQAPPPAHNPARSPPTPPPTDAISAASPASRPPRPTPEPLDGAAAHRDLARSRGAVPRPHRPGSQRHRLTWEETDASGRAGWTPDGWTLDGWTPDRRTPDDEPRTTDPGRRTQVTGHRTGWTPDGLDTGRAGQPDPGRRNWMGGHRMLDADRRRTPWLASWRCRPSDDADAGSPLEAPPGRRRLGDQHQDSSAGRTTRGTTLLGRAWPPRRQSAAGDTPPFSWRLGALLSCVCVLDLDGTSGGQWDYGKVRGCGVGLVRRC